MIPLLSSINWCLYNSFHLLFNKVKVVISEKTNIKIWLSLINSSGILYWENSWPNVSMYFNEIVIFFFSYLLCFVNGSEQYDFESSWYDPDLILSKIDVLPTEVSPKNTTCICFPFFYFKNSLIFF